MNNAVGLVEIAALLGVSRQRADQLSQTSGFPKAAITLTGSHLWERTQVEAWAQESRIEAGNEADEPDKVRYADRIFPVRDGVVLVPTTAVEGPKSDPNLEWIRYVSVVIDGTGFGGALIKMVPRRLWNEHIDHLGGLR